MSSTLDEFVEKYKSVAFLKENLKSNIDVYCDEMPEEEKESLLRMHMIMVRQCLNNFGAK